MIGYTLANRERTTNAIRLARWAVLAVAIVAASTVVLALVSPVTAAGLVSSGTVTGSTLAFLRRRAAKRA
ncbi:hypothetical protein [Amycolatopsis taiwanensis]|uniref:hypothetical protein n=1 Tax=Amycolatopsis taiwanensis TaxID=342230 RepID=UPI002555A915|nr:hypothetical protein [Amycolatopsis taiwanensis]